MKIGLKRTVMHGVLVLVLFFAAGVVTESEAIPLPNITLGIEDADDLIRDLDQALAKACS